MEEILMDHPEVADCAVIGAKDELKGEVPVGFVIVNAGSQIDPAQLEKELVESVREYLGPVASFKKVAVVKALPKTRSGKTLRGTMSKIANGQEYTITPTVEDPAIFEYLEPIIKALVARK
jgi:propionyl-CoA synthetase